LAFDKEHCIKIIQGKKQTQQSVGIQGGSIVERNVTSKASRTAKKWAVKDEIRVPIFLPPIFLPINCIGTRQVFQGEQKNAEI